MQIGIIGISGFIGNEFSRRATESGHTVIGFSRHPDQVGKTNIEMRPFDLSRPLSVQDLDAIVNFSGRSIFTPWTKRNRRNILHSRIDSTRHIVDSLKIQGEVRVLVNISAVGYYGDRGEEELDETSAPGMGFLSEVTRAWEAEALRAAECHVRVVLPRLGMVLGRQGGAMKLMKPIFRSGLGGRLGSGHQWMSCIHVRDVAKIILFTLENENIKGPVNAVFPDPLRNVDFTRILAHAAHRPAILPVPALALKFALGSMSHLMLDSQNVLPMTLLEADYAFCFPDFEAAVRDIL